MTFEEILKLISLYHESIVRITESRLIVEASKRLYGENTDFCRTGDYELLCNWRDARSNLIEAIKQYKEQK